MSLQDKLSKSSIGLKRKLFDLAVHTSGTKCKVIRLHIKEDRYRQSQKTLISTDPIEIFLDLPEELPMTRLRKDVTEAQAKTENIFFFETLPIDGFAKFEDNVEYGDIV